MAGARNLLAERESVTKTQQASIYILGWLSLLLAGTSGAYAAEAWIGDTLRWILNLFPWDDLPNVLLIVGGGGIFLDLIKDLTPNRTSLTAFMLGPAIATASDGKLASRVSDWSNWLQNHVGGHISEWAGSLGAFGVAAVAGGLAWGIGLRVLQKQSAAKAAAGGGR